MELLQRSGVQRPRDGASLCHGALIRVLLKPFGHRNIVNWRFKGGHQLCLDCAIPVLKPLRHGNIVTWGFKGGSSIVPPLC